MLKSKPVQLKPLDFPEARSLFRSLFMEGWREQYPTWQEAISAGSLHWSFTATTFRETLPELDQLLTYPEADVATWIAKICSGLPAGSPNPSLTRWEREGKPTRT